MKDELYYSYNVGGVAYLMQSIAIHFNLIVYQTRQYFKDEKAEHVFRGFAYTPPL